MTTGMEASRLMTSALLVVLLANALAGCRSDEPGDLAVKTSTRAPTVTLTITPSVTPTLTPTPKPLPTLSGTTHLVDTGWVRLGPGLERRMAGFLRAQEEVVEALYIVRLDQERFRLDVGYHETPQTLEDWQSETKAAVVMNGGYFRIENDRYLPDGLIIVNGRALGNSYGDYAGMLAITREGAELSWLADQPYDPTETLLAGMQSFPMLVKPGGELGFPEPYEDGVRARRTVIGQDREGRILLIVAPRGYFTLHEMSAYLTASDLDLDIAVNLDGGPSSGILLDRPREIISAQSLLPLVILAYAR